MQNHLIGVGPNGVGGLYAYYSFRTFISCYTNQLNKKWEKEIDGIEPHFRFIQFTDDKRIIVYGVRHISTMAPINGNISYQFYDFEGNMLEEKILGQTFNSFSFCIPRDTAIYFEKQDEENNYSIVEFSYNSQSEKDIPVAQSWSLLHFTKICWKGLMGYQNDSTFILMDVNSNPVYKFDDFHFDESYPYTLFPIDGKIFSWQIPGNGQASSPTVTLLSFDIDCPFDFHQLPKDSIKLFPNPFSNNLSICFPEQDCSASWKLSVTDYLGRRLNEFEFGSNRSVVVSQLEFLPPGIFFFEFIKEETGESVFKKVVKQ